MSKRVSWLVRLGLCFVLVAALQAQDSELAYRNPRPIQDRRAVVYWDGVNACKPSKTPGREYKWQDHAKHMSGEFGSTLEYQRGEFAKPFSIMARKDTPREELAASFDSYLSECEKQSKTPFVVFAPSLNIEGYLASFLLEGVRVPGSGLEILIDRAIDDAEKTIREDTEWIRKVAPVILSKLKEAGYEVDGYAHSWGASMALNALLATKDVATGVSLRFLLVMNGRAAVSSLRQLEDEGIVATLKRLTTSGDALTYWGKAAVGPADILIKRAIVPGWDTLRASALSFGP